jgi:hypothetical protein
LFASVLFLMLTRLKLTRGEGQLVEPSSHPTRRKHIPSPQVLGRHSPSMAHEESHEHVPAEDEDLRKAVMEMREMMNILMEKNVLSQGEGSNPSRHKGNNGDKTPDGNGGNGASPPRSPPSSHHLLLLLVQDLFRILQRGMVKLLRKFLH